MLLVLTIERYVSVCHPSHMRPALGPPRYDKHQMNHVFKSEIFIPHLQINCDSDPHSNIHYLLAKFISL